MLSNQLLTTKVLKKPINNELPTNTNNKKTKFKTKIIIKFLIKIYNLALKL